MWLQVSRNHPKVHKYLKLVTSFCPKASPVEFIPVPFIQLSSQMIVKSGKQKGASKK